MEDSVELERQLEMSHRMRLEEIEKIGGGSERYRARTKKGCC